MSNTRHARRFVPLTPEPSDDLARFAAALDLVLDRHHFLPGCEPCVAVAKRAEHAHGVAVGNARAAAEPEPVFDCPPIQQAVTWQDGRPVCFAHYEPDGTAGDSAAG